MEVFGPKVIMMQVCKALAFISLQREAMVWFHMNRLTSGWPHKLGMNRLTSGWPHKHLSLHRLAAALFCMPVKYTHTHTHTHTHSHSPPELIITSKHLDFSKK